MAQLLPAHYELPDLRAEATPTPVETWRSDPPGSCIIMYEDHGGVTLHYSG